MFSNDVTEGEALNDWVEDELEEHSAKRGNFLGDLLGNLRKAHTDVKYAQIGDKVRCPNCNKKFVKKSYQHTFCTSVKHGKGNCKDKYYNRVQAIKAKLRIACSEED